MDYYRINNLLISYIMYTVRLRAGPNALYLLLLQPTDLRRNVTDASYYLSLVSVFSKLQ